MPPAALHIGTNTCKQHKSRHLTWALSVSCSLSLNYHTSKRACIAIHLVAQVANGKADEIEISKVLVLLDEET